MSLFWNKSYIKRTIIGTKERKERELAQRKKLILDASKKLFFSKGFHNVSIQDICKEIEYGKSVVYALFQSKEEIYGYIYVEATSILADLLQEIDTSKSDPARTFEICTEKIYSFYSKYKSYYTALFFFDIDHVACNKIPQFLLDKKLSHKKRAEEPVKTLLESGQKTGVLKDFDCSTVINSYFASLLGIINSFIAEDNPDNKILHAMMIEHGKIYDAGLRKN